MIELENLTKHYGAKVAVSDLNLVVPRGELFAFLGPNGAGKTTTIKMLVGLLRPSSGTVRLCGVDVVENPREAGGRLGYVPDDAYLYDKLSGREILRFVADMHGFDAREAKARIARQIESFSLADFVDELTETYSHGMKQRLVFATALLHDPEVLVVDEPMVGLDPRSVRLVKDLLRAKAAAGTAIFLSTHTLSMAEEIADRIGIVDHGELRFLGTVAELRRQLPGQDRSLEQFFLRLTADDNHGGVEAAAQNPA